MNDHPNLDDPRWDAELDDPPFACRAMRIGMHAGAQELGATLYEIDPGGAISPYHAHHANEELLLVLSGTPRLRTPYGERTLKPGAVVAFPRGAGGAHRVTNAGDAPEPARVVIVSTTNFPDVAEYPDHGTWLTMTGPESGKAFPAGADVPVMEAVLEGMGPAEERGAGVTIGG